MESGGWRVSAGLVGTMALWHRWTLRILCACACMCVRECACACACVHVCAIVHVHVGVISVGV